MICRVRLGGNRNHAEDERRAGLLGAGIEDGFAIVGGVHAWRREPIAHVGDAIISQNHGGPAAMPDRRHAAFSDRLGFFEHRRFPVVLEENHVVAGLFLHRFARAGQDVGFRLADDFLLIRVFPDGGRGCATGDGRQSQQTAGGRQETDSAGLGLAQVSPGGGCLGGWCV